MNGSLVNLNQENKDMIVVLCQVESEKVKCHFVANLKLIVVMLIMSILMGKHVLKQRWNHELKLNLVNMVKVS